MDSSTLTVLVLLMMTRVRFDFQFNWMGGELWMYVVESNLEWAQFILRYQPIHTHLAICTRIK